jgi:DNA-binding NarL/FixJ family response regulator
MIRVLLADDHPVLRMGLRILLNKASDIQVVAEAGDGAEALRLIKELKPDVTILDYQLPKLSGAEVAKEIQKGNLSTRVLALSSHKDIRTVRDMLGAGAVGYLVKDEAPQVIIEAVRTVVHDSWFSPSIATHVLTLMHNKQAVAPGKEILTKRESEVLNGLMKGKTNIEIGRDLHISHRTVAYHVENIFNKLGVNNRTEAVVQAIRRGWIEL